MRAWIVPLVLGLTIIAWTGLASASDPQDDAQHAIEDVKEQLGVDVTILDSEDSSPESVAPGPDGSAADGAGLLAFADVVTVPIQLMTKGLVDLGLELINGFLFGINEGVSTFGVAAETVAAHPVRSAAIAVAAIALLGMAGLTTLGMPRYGSLGAIPLFSRIAKSDLLDNGVRSEIFELIRANPGVNASEISRRLDIAWGTTTHHLQKLRAEKLVAIRVVARQKCFFVNGGTYTPREMDVMSATKQETARRIAEFLVSHGPTAHHRIVHELGISPALASYHLSKLSRAGLVQSARQGRQTIFSSIEANLNPAPRPVMHTL